MSLTRFNRMLEAEVARDSGADPSAALAAWGIEQDGLSERVYKAVCEVNEQAKPAGVVALADSLGVPTTTVSSALRRLKEQKRVIQLEGRRGWVAVKK
jgi:hypothetical protein